MFRNTARQKYQHRNQSQYCGKNTGNRVNFRLQTPKQQLNKPTEHITMQQNFINIRLDRLKYADLSLLYRGIEHIISEFDGEDLHLKIPFARYSEKSALLKSLETKDRSKYYADEYAKQLKRSDELVSALLLHLKALNRAAFPESLYIAESVYKFIRKALGNFVHVGADKKKAALDVILWNFNPKQNSWYEDAVTLGISRYFEELSLVREKLDSIENAEKEARKGQAKSSEAIKAKAELISEMRLLLQCIDVTALNYPDKDYSKLIAKINYELKTERAQLRNLQTRRMKKKTAP